MKTNKILKLITIIGLGVVVCLSINGKALAADNPFTCSSNFYQVISGQLELLDPLTGTYTNIGSQQADTYNAIGYNVLDNYIYGIKTSATDGVGAIGNLVRIGSDGTLTDLGPVSGLPVSGYVNGSLDLNGNMYIRTGNHTIYKINVTTMTATPLTIAGDTIVNGDDNVFINNNLYLLVGSSLSVVNLSTNTATTATVSGPSGWLTAGASFGAGWTDQAGELFFSSNGSGSIYQITNLTSATPTATFKVPGTVTSNNDGTSCTLAVQNPFSPPLAVNDNYIAPFDSSLKESISLLSNDAGNALSIVSNTAPAHGSVMINANGTFTYTPKTGYSGPDSFEYTASDSFGRLTTATVTITVSPQVVSTLSSPDTGFGAAPQSSLLVKVLIAASFITASIVILTAMKVKASRTRV